MKPGDLVSFAGMRAWGIMIVIQTSGDPVGACRYQVLKQDGGLAWISPLFLELINETR